jgi:hypothetical protein
VTEPLGDFGAAHGIIEYRDPRLLAGDDMCSLTWVNAALDLVVVLRWVDQTSVDAVCGRFMAAPRA